MHITINRSLVNYLNNTYILYIYCLVINQPNLSFQGPCEPFPQLASFHKRLSRAKCEAHGDEHKNMGVLKGDVIFNTWFNIYIHNIYIYINIYT